MHVRGSMENIDAWKIDTCLPFMKLLDDWFGDDFEKHLSGRTKEECSLAFIAQKYEERDTVNDKTSTESVIHINDWRDNSLSSKLVSKLVELGI